MEERYARRGQNTLPKSAQNLLSALARLDVDPWQEATSLARMPREAAAMRLSALIDTLPPEPRRRSIKDERRRSVRAVAEGQVSNAHPSENMFAATRLRQTQMLVAFGAFAIMMLIVFAMSALFSPGPGVGANPSANRVADAAMTPPRKLDP